MRHLIRSVEVAVPGSADGEEAGRRGEPGRGVSDLKSRVPGQQRRLGTGLVTASVVKIRLTGALPVLSRVPGRPHRPRPGLQHPVMSALTDMLGQVPPAAAHAIPA